MQMFNGFGGIAAARNGKMTVPEPFPLFKRTRTFCGLLVGAQIYKSSDIVFKQPVYFFFGKVFGKITSDITQAACG